MLISGRIMPKRPSALALSPDGNTIYSGDKFGDVYSLPLIPSERPIASRKTPLPVALHEPAATTLTVHTKRNLMSLEQQLRYRAQAPEKPIAPTAEQNMMLNHMSLLTDLALVTIPSGASTNGSRSYLITADRDEHIRVSRGPPQTHIIEAYCLGHTSFISKICVPSSLPELLISAGGDDHLLVWNWQAGEILQKVPLSRDTVSTPVVVSGIWEIRPAMSDQTFILVAIEGYERSPG
jgi:tRNA (guanine-N(7)-)-methyltransferase subunit TRM82